MNIYIAIIEGLDGESESTIYTNKGWVLYETLEEALISTASTIFDHECYNPNKELYEVRIQEHFCAEGVQNLIDAANGDMRSLNSRSDKTLFRLEAENDVIFQVFKGLRLVHDQEQEEQREQEEVA